MSKTRIISDYFMEMANFKLNLERLGEDTQAKSKGVRGLSNRATSDSGEHIQKEILKKG